MSLLLGALKIHTPEFVKRLALVQLFKATAAAFAVDVPSIKRLDSRRCLAEYARFVKTQAEQRLHEESDVEALAQRLYQNAFEIGQLPGKWLRPHTVQEVMAIGRVLYQILAIDLQGDAGGNVVIKRCYFSQFYSAEVCRLMSAMDRGLFAGLSNGGKLTFTSRITERQPCCRAHFYYPTGEFNCGVTVSGECSD